MKTVSIRNAAYVSIGAKYLQVLLQMLFSAVLSRVLTPDDFGITAIVMVFSSFFMLFANIGFGTALVQNKTLSLDESSDIFSFTVILAVVISFLFGIFAIPLSLFYQNAVYIPLGLLLAVSLLFNTMNMIPSAMLQKEKRFLTIGVRSIVVFTVCSGITIFLAIRGLRYYAIAINAVLTSLFMFLWNLFGSGLRFRYKFNKESVGKILDFSKYQFAFNIVNYFSRNLDNLLIGKVLGPTQLAFYNRAYNLSVFPISNLTHAITPVLHPILSDYQHDSHYIYHQYIKVVKILSLLGVYISVFCFLASEEIILIMYGDQWGSAVVSFRLLSLSIWSQMITSSTGSIFQSLGRTREMFQCGIYSTTLLVISILAGMLIGSIEAVALLVAIGYSLNFIVTFNVLLRKGFGRKFFVFARLFFPDVLVLVFTAIGMLMSSRISSTTMLYSLLIKGVGGGIAFIIGLFVAKQQNAFKVLFPRFGTRRNRSN